MEDEMEPVAKLVNTKGMKGDVHEVITRPHLPVIFGRSVDYSYTQIMDAIIRLTKTPIKYGGRKEDIIGVVEEMGSEVVYNLFNTACEEFKFQYRNNEHVVSGDELLKAFFSGVKKQLSQMTR